jgi:electron transfer flavoprotein alpha subunit
MPNVLAVTEQRDGVLRRVSREVVTAARALADSMQGDVHALIAGAEGVAGLAPVLGAVGADVVRVAEHAELGRYVAEHQVRVVVDAVGGEDYFAVVFAASAEGKDLAPRVAARLGQPLATDVTGLAVEGDVLVVRRPMYSGKLLAAVEMTGSPRLVSVRPNVFVPVERPAPGTIRRLDVSVNPSAERVRLREFRAVEGEALDVAEASIVVSGGRGMQGPEHWELLESLRSALGATAALGASRAVVDAGWRPHAEQVGQTGKTVSPRLYIAVGISGAIQHLAGMRTAGTIVAINKDADAPIFQVADYGIVGDAFEVVPRLVEELQRLNT